MIQTIHKVIAQPSHRQLLEWFLASQLNWYIIKLGKQELLVGTNRAMR